MPTPIQEAISGTGKRLNIVCIGAHPDDPECGCGGTLALLSRAGHRVTIVYLTRGEAGIKDLSSPEAAIVRTREALEANKILGTNAVFAGQVDGFTVVNQKWIDKVTRLVDQLEPDIVFTHWPVDTHPDHQAASVLTTQAWHKLGQRFTLYYYEVCGATSKQTMAFEPVEFVDIGLVQDLKHQALLCHKSQEPDKILRIARKTMEELRGQEIGVDASEAFMGAHVYNKSTSNSSFVGARERT